MNRSTGVIAVVLGIALLGADAAPQFTVGGGWLATTGGSYVLPQRVSGQVPNIQIRKTPLTAKTLDIQVSDFTRSTLAMDPKLTSTLLTRCVQPTWLVTYTVTFGGHTSHVEHEFVAYGNDVYHVVYSTPDGIAVDDAAENAMHIFCGYH